MHVLVATDGNLAPEPVVRYAAPLAGDGGKVTVMTVVEIPRRLLQEIRGIYGEMRVPDVEADAEYVGVAARPSDPGPAFPGDDRIISQYLESKRVELTDSLVEALRGAGVPAEGTAVEGEDAAYEIIKAARDLGVDAIVCGTRGRGALGSLIGSVSLKLVRHAPCPVMVLRGEAAERSGNG